MKATIDLPEDLLRAVKIRSVERGVKLKDWVADALRSALEAAPGTRAQPADPLQVWCARLQPQPDGQWLNPSAVIEDDFMAELESLRDSDRAQEPGDPWAGENAVANLHTEK
jgi:hypothetical protein